MPWFFSAASPAHVFGNFPSSKMQSVTSSVPAPMCVSSCTSSLPAATYKSTGWQTDFQHGAASDYLAQQVFGEMPTPHSLHGTHAIAPGYWNHSYCHQTPIPSSCVQGGSNLSEKTVDGSPQAYGLHNLNCQSVFRADGSEHNYFALPEIYPLEQAVPEPVFDVYGDETEDCSNAFVDVSVSTPEQQPYAEDQQEAEQPPKCFSRPNFSPLERATCEPVFDAYDDGTDGSATEFVDVFLGNLEQQKYEDQHESGQLAKCFGMASENASSEQLKDFSKALETEQTSIDVSDYTFEQQYQNDEKASTNVQQLRDTQLDVLVIHERKKEWDPGTSLPLRLSKIHHSVSLLVPNLQLPTKVQDVSHLFKETPVYDIYAECATTGRCCLDPSVDIIEAVAIKVEVKVHSAKPTFNHKRPLDVVVNLRKPDNEQIVMCTNKASDHPFSEDATNFAYILPCLFVDRAIDCCVRNLKIELCSLPESALCCTPGKPRQVNKQQWNMQMSKPGRKEWDPGILSQMEMLIRKITVPNLVHRSETPIKLLLFIVHPIDLKHFMSQLLLQCHLWCPTLNDFPKVQYCCLQIVLACPNSIPVFYSRMFCLTEAIQSAIYSMSTATPVHMILILSYEKISEEHKDAVAVYLVFEIQLPMRKISLIWDPEDMIAIGCCNLPTSTCFSAMILSCTTPRDMELKINK